MCLIRNTFGYVLVLQHCTLGLVPQYTSHQMSRVVVSYRPGHMSMKIDYNWEVAFFFLYLQTIYIWIIMRFKGVFFATRCYNFIREFICNILKNYSIKINSFKFLNQTWINPKSLLIVGWRSCQGGQPDNAMF